MYTIEPLDGKKLDEAADVMAKQIKYVCGEIGRWEDNTPNTTSFNLRQLLDSVEKVKDNVRFLLNSSNIRLNAKQSKLKRRLMEIGELT